MRRSVGSCSGRKSPCGRRLRNPGEEGGETCSYEPKIRPKMRIEGRRGKTRRSGGIIVYGVFRTLVIFCISCDIGLLMTGERSARAGRTPRGEVVTMGRPFVGVGDVEVAAAWRAPVGGNPGHNNA